MTEMIEIIVEKMAMLYIPRLDLHLKTHMNRHMRPGALLFRWVGAWDSWKPGTRMESYIE
jgi:hypothetical protein